MKAMKVGMTAGTLVVAGIFLTTVCVADDAQDIKTALKQHYAAFNAGDADGYIRYEAEGHTTYGPEGGLLGSNPSHEVQKKNQQAVFDGGMKYDLHTRNTEVKVYGSLSAVSTSYVTGTRTLPDGTVHRVTWRRSAMWVKQGGVWKQVHRHFSPLRLPQ